MGEMLHAKAHFENLLSLFKKKIAIGIFKIKYSAWYFEYSLKFY